MFLRVVVKDSFYSMFPIFTFQDEYDTDFRSQIYRINIVNSPTGTDVLKPFFVLSSHEHDISSGPNVIKLFSYSTQLSMKFILLINVKMPTSVSMINTTSKRLKARNFFICKYFGFMSS